MINHCTPILVLIFLVSYEIPTKVSTYKWPHSNEQSSSSSSPSLSHNFSKPHGFSSTTVSSLDHSDSHQPTKRVFNETAARRRSLSTDCMGKRDGILKRLFEQYGQTKFQKLQPRQETNQTNHRQLDALGYREHVPQCNDQGFYEPVQCHKAIGYCWCVNKFGQALKDSAVPLSVQPSCDISLYDRDSLDSQVVTGVSADRIKNLLREKKDRVHAGSYDQDSVLEELETDNIDSANNHEDDFKRRVSASEQPSLALVPNECTLSRDHAYERAARHPDNSIWIPECDPSNEKMYAEKQCHASKVCWCVDQITGLPLRTNEQLSAKTNINCTEIKRSMESARATPLLSAASPHSSKPSPTSIYAGFSDSCDASDRAELVYLLLDQFRHHISEHVKSNSSSPLRGISQTAATATNRLNDGQVSSLKFSLIDLDGSGILDDREWSRFRNNFKLIDSFEGHQHEQLLSDSYNKITSILLIPKPQRRCWRDFLLFCSSGDLLSNGTINLSKWLSCTELPSKLNPLAHEKIRGASVNKSSNEGSSAYTKEAARVRSMSKNPFSHILKPD